MSITVVAHHARHAERADMDARWRFRAACKGRAEVLDPPGGFVTLPQLWEARDLCRGCPVFTQCRRDADALESGNDPGGMIAGLTEADRSRLRHSARPLPRAAATCGALTCSKCQKTKTPGEFGTDPKTGLPRVTCLRCSAYLARRRAARKAAKKRENA